MNNNLHMNTHTTHLYQHHIYHGRTAVHLGSLHFSTKLSLDFAVEGCSCKEDRTSSLDSPTCDSNNVALHHAVSRNMQTTFTILNIFQ